jgi:hypothetical protein
MKGIGSEINFHPPGPQTRDGVATAALRAADSSAPGRNNETGEVQICNENDRLRADHLCLKNQRKDTDYDRNKNSVGRRHVQPGPRVRWLSALAFHH